MFQQDFNGGFYMNNMPKLKPLSVVYGEYGLNTGFRTRSELLKRLLVNTTGTPGDWLTFERQIACKIVQKENSNILIRIPRTRSVGNLVKNFTSIKWGKLPEELGLSYNLVLAHSFNSVFTASALKKRFRAPLLLDIHGVWLEEVMSWSNSKSSLKANFLRLIEEVMLSSVDGLIYASNILKEVLVSKYPALAYIPSTVIHCAVDPGIFMYNQAARDKLRAEWGWRDYNVIIHSGIKAPWVDVLGIQQFVKTCLEHFPQIRFLFLANDPTEWEKVLKDNENKEKIKIISVEHRDMPSYLSAADIGLVARFESTINRVASPTKISEYFAIGLPVLMTEGIGDYDLWVKQFNLGSIVTNLVELTEENISCILEELLAVDKIYISSWAKSNLSIFNYLKNFRDIIESLT
jgi:hypothetical protein